MNKTKYLHIATIILGIIFITIPIFHNNLWFDESYSVEMANKSFVDIWQIGSNDVHPILYYWILHIVYLIFGSNLYIYRIISAIPLVILGVLGYTHIRKDFGEKEGILFSFFTFFLPINCVYSGEIRMYTHAMLFVTIMAIYAYRIYKNSSIKNWVIFAIFSLASAYTHYYALLSAGIINLILFIYLICKSVKMHKNNLKNKLYNKELKKFTISALIQILLYIPWIMSLLLQIKGVSEGYWITGPSLEIFKQIFIFQFVGNLDVIFVNNNLAIIFGLVLTIFTVYTLIKSKDKNAGKWAILVYLLVMFVALIISIKMPILYARYFLTLTGLFIFFMAFFMAKSQNKILTIFICLFTLIVAGIVNINVIKMNYSEINQKPIEYVKQELKDNDIMIWGNEGSGFSLATQLNNINTYFYDEQYWNQELAYKAFGENMNTIKTLEPLDNYKGRIWIINSENYAIYDQFVQKYGNDIKLIKQEIFFIEYHGYKYSISLVEKN